MKLSNEVKSKIENKIKTLALAVSLGAAFVLSASSAQAYDLEAQLKKGKVIAKKGDAEIREGFLELVKRVNPGIERNLKTPAGRKRLIDNLLDQEILYQASVKKGLDKSEKVNEKAALFRRIIVSREIEDQSLGEQAKDYYDKNKEVEYRQVKVAHILISTRPAKPKKKDPKAKKPDAAKKKADLAQAKIAAEKKAKDIHAQLKKGGDWKKLVAANSDDRYSKKKDGDIGYLTKNHRNAKRLDWQKMIDKAFAMKKGEISEPILAKDGYHILKLIEEPSYKKFDEAKSSIEYKIRRTSKATLIKKLVGESKVEYLDPALAKYAADEAKKPKAPQGQRGQMPFKMPAKKK